LRRINGIAVVLASWAECPYCESNNSCLAGLLLDCTVGRGIWPRRSPDFRPLQFFLWNFLKKDSAAITQEASRNLNIKMSRLLLALTKKLF